MVYNEYKILLHLELFSSFALIEYMIIVILYRNISSLLGSESIIQSNAINSYTFTSW